MSSGAREFEREAGDDAPVVPVVPVEPVRAARVTLDAWLQSGADRANPVRFYLIDAMERRASRHQGETRRLLNERIEKLMAEYGAALAKTARAPRHELSATPQHERETPASLRTLVTHLATGATADHATNQPVRAAYPELDALDYFRELWARVRTDMQVRQSLEQVPGNAGPLNSSSLVHRSLSLMRELSPGYLKQFLSYVDALSWMEQLNGGITPAKDAPRKETARKEPTRASGSGKSSRSKAR